MIKCSVETEEDVQVDSLIKELLEPSKAIVLWNDKYNTFDHVILCLINYCDHTMIQAEQCAMVVHNNGKCLIKKGDIDKLKPIKEALQEKGLTVTIE
jgi:ATP-dependent Clp protease adaptor protein ClpS|tara:strand:- start:3296 stop:3586 length:291 start_codon:yes stop_codon:yes gene_type:complete